MKEESGTKALALRLIKEYDSIFAETAYHEPSVNTVSLPNLGLISSTFL